MKIEGKEIVFFGVRKSDNARIYITKPSWDCGWYWGFGYLGNRNEHYHLEDYQKKDRSFSVNGGLLEVITEARNINMYDALREDYELSPSILSNLWEFCELVKTAYTLKETAEVLRRGGSHYTQNPCADTIKNQDEYNRINNVVLPEIFKRLQEIIEG
ncbi:MAG TPA: hypothetical protein VLA13_01685 [Massilibacterium sp.]|nr:hypothetical protein [Massilibacterium sp.]